MGRSTTPKYVLVFKSYGTKFFNTPQGWDTKNAGRPSDVNLKKWVEKFNESLLPGQCNSHLGTESTVMSAEIRFNRAGGATVAKYSGPLFQVI